VRLVLGGPATVILTWLTGVLGFLLDEAWVDFALVLWDGTWGGKSSPNPMGGRWCEVDFDRGRSRMDTSSTGGDSCPAFARLCWEERSDALATGCVTGAGLPLLYFSPSGSRGGAGHP
jgi:hypothetical protein